MTDHPGCDALATDESSLKATVTGADVPVVRRLPPSLSTVEAFRRLVPLPSVLFLDSSMRGNLGRYSFLAADPFDTLVCPADGSDALALLDERLARWQSKPIAGLPPFQGGAAGLWGYDLHRSLEKVPLPVWDEFQIPSLAVAFYDVVLAWDHEINEAWLISQGYPETDPDARCARAQNRAEWFLELLSGRSAVPGAMELTPARENRRLASVRTDILAPHVPVGGVYSNFTRADYLAAVNTAIDYVHAGDVFQVNLAQRLLAPAVDHAASLYLRLRERTPATFGGYFDAGSCQIASVSPERFLKVTNRRVETRPIKGTRQRVDRPEVDLFAADDLLTCEKERAENIMIVDLSRNDLSRVCQPGSLCVSQLCGLEGYGYVQHLVSVVRGELERGQSVLDLVRASFPGGSITGAPKVRAMEIIGELERTARGAYCGSLGYIGFDGTCDLSILIRTVTACGGWWQMQVGGGITAESVPKREYEETWHKAAGVLKGISE